MKDKLSVVFEVLLSVLGKIWIWILIAIIVWIMAFNSEKNPLQIVDHSSAKEPVLEYEDQDTINLTLSSPDTLNPYVSKSEEVFSVNQLIYESLFEYNQDLKLVKSLVSKYSVDTEKAYVDITLAKGVYFHNGNKLTADDVVFTVNCLKESKKGTAYYEIGQKITSCYKTSTYSLRIHFKNNYNCSLYDLVFPIVPSNEYSSVSSFLSSSNFKPIGTGPYKVKKYDSLKFLRLSPYSDYHGDKRTKKIEFAIVPDDTEIDQNLMEIGQVTCYSDSSKNRKTTASDKNFVVYDYPQNQVDFIVLNTNNAQLKNKSFRQAVLNSIDRNDILENCYMGDGILTDTVYYPNYMGVEDTLDHYNDVSEARRLLKLSGYSDSDKDGYLEKHSSKETFTIRIIVNKDNAMRTAAAKAIKNDLEQVGIKASVSLLSQKEYKAAITGNSFDILVTGYTINQNYDLRFLYNKKGDWKYVNYTILEYVNNLERLHTIDEYQEIYSVLKDAMIDEAVYFPLAYKNSSLIGVTTFEAETLPMFNNRYYGLETWNWKKIL